jgi:hypothetical protein
VHVVVGAGDAGADVDVEGVGRGWLTDVVGVPLLPPPQANARTSTRTSTTTKSTARRVQ